MTNTSDLTPIAILQARLQRRREPDGRLGLEILAIIDPTSGEGELAASLLQNFDEGDMLPGLPTNLDITASMDAAFSLVDRLLPGADWALFYNRPVKGGLLNASGPYSVHIETPGVIYFGVGWTRATCLLDGLLRALQPLDAKANANACERDGEREDVPI